MRCPKCDSKNVGIGADGNVYCSECMATIEGAELVIMLGNLTEILEEFFENTEHDDRSLVLEHIQSWVEQKGEYL